MEAKLIKIDRNGSKHYEGYVTCDRCSGRGEYWWGYMEYVGNGVTRPQYSGVCFKCGGEGKVWGKWIERTPEYQAKLDAKREAKIAAMREKREAEEAERKAAEAARKAEEEARIKAEKAISNYIGEIGKRITVEATYLHSAHFEVKSFRGFGTDTMYVHNFKDQDGNKIVWKTGSGLANLEEGDTVQIVGTVKEHAEYKEEKQTALTRCKITKE